MDRQREHFRARARSPKDGNADRATRRGASTRTNRIGRAAPIDRGGAAARRTAQPAHDAGNARRADRRGAYRPRHRDAADARPGRSPIPVVAFVAALVALCLIIGIGASTCSTSEEAAHTPYASAYDWSNLSWSGDRLGYVQDGTVASRIGVDVSDHQGWIDWNAVASDGIDFAMIRLGNRGYTEGSLALDDYFSYNIDGAASAGLDVGVYFFSQATTPDEAREEAQFVLDQLAGRPLQLPVAFDHEPISNAAGRANDVEGADLAACMEAFCETVEAAGYETMIYGNRSDMARFSPVDGTAEAASALSQTIGGRSVWFAEYGVSAPAAPFDFAMWQYTNTGQVAGIDTAVDLNILLPDA